MSQEDIRDVSESDRKSGGPCFVHRWTRATSCLPRQRGVVTMAYCYDALRLSPVLLV